MKLVLPLLMYKVEKKKEKWVVPSWNHLYTMNNNRPFLDKYAKKHKEDLANAAKKWVNENNWTLTENKKVAVRMWVYWNDKRRKDCHNLDKLICDSFNEVIYDDDCNALVQFMDFSFDKENPRIEVEFEVIGDVFE